MIMSSVPANIWQLDTLFILAMIAIRKVSSKNIRMHVFPWCKKEYDHHGDDNRTKCER